MAIEDDEFGAEPDVVENAAEVAPGLAGLIQEIPFGRDWAVQPRAEMASVIQKLSW